MNNSTKIIMVGAAIAIVLSILAPFLASSNPDGLDKNLIELVGGGNQRTAEEIIHEKKPIDYESPMPDYSIEGMGKAGEVGAILIGSLLLLLIGIGFGKIAGKNPHK